MNLRDLRALDSRLHDRIAEEEEPPEAEPKSKREVVPGSKRTSGGWTYQLEYVRCGKERCRNDRHGPYWYGYRTSGGRTVSKYFGKKLPGADNGQRQKAGKSRWAKKRA